MFNNLRKNKDPRFKLGIKGKDILSDFEGILEARIEYITGCDQYHIRAKALPSKKPADYWAFSF